MQPPKRFFHSLDGIRGIAAILVVLFHTGLYFGGIRFPESYLAVDIFFVLSGVVIGYTYEKRLQSGLSALQFIWIRVARIYPLYFFGTALMLITVLGFYQAHPDAHLAVHTAFAAVLIPNPSIGTVAFFPLNVPAWSLFLELAVNIFYASLLRYLNTRAMLAIMLLSALGMAGCLIEVRPHSLSLGWKNLGWHGFGMIGGLCRVGYSFFAGVLLYRIYSKRRFVQPMGALAKHAPWAILATVAALLMAAPPVGLQPYFDFVSVVALFPAVIYVALWFQPTGIAARLCKTLGALSYAVYAIHYPLGILCQDLLQALGMPVQRYAPWIGLYFLALLLTLCWGLNKLYDEPVRRYLTGLWPARPAALPEEPRSRATASFDRPGVSPLV
jgi:peptidoglycan/LPS O-acetylase OafA/YrhL